MNKKEFTAELKELMSTMSEEEIEKTINALNGCKMAISRKSDQEKGEKARLLLTVELNRSELRCVGSDNREGTVKIYGASLLTSGDYRDYSGIIPETKGNWWLYSRAMIRNGELKYNYCIPRDAVAAIRPVLVVEELGEVFKPGDTLYINGGKFSVLSPYLLIKSSCLDDLCSFHAVNYECSLLKLCVDGWYAKLIKENEKTDEANAT